MALIKISADVFINPDKIEAVEFREDSVHVIMSDRSYQITDVTGNVFNEIQKLTGSSTESLNILARNTQRFAG